MINDAYETGNLEVESVDVDGKGLFTREVVKENDAESKQDRELCDAATARPWHVSESRGPDGGLGVWDGEEYVAWPEAGLSDADAAFIAASRTRWPRALDEIERLKKHAEDEYLRGLETHAAMRRGLADKIERLRKEVAEVRDDADDMAMDKDLSEQ